MQESLTPCDLPPDAPSIQVWRAFSGDRGEVPVARHWLIEQLGPHHPAAHSAGLVLTEVAGNAVTHARSGFTVEICATDDSVHAAVSDDGAACTSPEVKHADLTDESGRGMLLVDAYADYWGSERTDDGHRTTWFGVTA